MEMNWNKRSGAIAELFRGPKCKKGLNLLGCMERKTSIIEGWKVTPGLRPVYCHRPFGPNNQSRTISLSKTPARFQPFGSIFRAE